MLEILQPWWLFAIVVIALGYVGSLWWASLFKRVSGRRVKAAWKSALSFWGRAFIRVGSFIIAAYLVPWHLLNIPESVIIGSGLVAGLVVAQFKHLIAALTGGLSLTQIGETIEIDGKTITVEAKDLMRISGSSPDGQFISIGYDTLANAPVTNWTRTPFARVMLDIHVCDVQFDLDAVYAAIDSVLRPGGELNPDYSICASSVSTSVERAFRGYAGQLPNSNLIEVGIYTRFRNDIPALKRQAHEEIWRACHKADIELGQVGHLYLDGGQIQSSQTDPNFKVI